MPDQMLLDDFFVTRLHIDWRQPTASAVDIDRLNLTCDYNVAYNAQDNSMFKMELSVRLSQVGKQQADVGYIIEADLVGLFSFPTEVDAEDRQMLVRVNGINLLYGTLRGILANMSGVFPSERLVLPAINPMDIVQQVETRKNKHVTADNAPKSEKTKRPPARARLSSVRTTR
jgi:preprotein translocase subunit SecB